MICKTVLTSESRDFCLFSVLSIFDNQNSTSFSAVHMKSFQLYHVLINHLVLSERSFNLFKTTGKFLPNHEYLRQAVRLIFPVRGRRIKDGVEFGMGWQKMKLGVFSCFF